MADESKVTDTRAKYIPPHQRRAATTTTTASTGASRPPANPMTHHARVRQQQREITPQAMQSALATGEHAKGGNATVSLDESTQVVRSDNGRIITVNRNMRNVKHDMRNHSTSQEEVLLAKIQRYQDDHAMCELAEMYLDGDVVNRDVQKAHNLLVRAAHKRNSHAMCLLSQIYQNGELGAPDPSQALKWMERAAERKNKYALAYMGQRCLNEFLRIPDAEKSSEQARNLLLTAVDYLKQGMAKQSTRAMWQLAKIYEEGYLGEKDLEKAIRIYSDAAKLGSPSSIETLQQFVIEGKIAERVFDDILDQASFLVGRTSSALAIEMGLKQIDGLLGKNPRRGYRMLEAAAKNGNQHALYKLAKCYQQGRGDIEPDLAKALKLFIELKGILEQALRQGNIPAGLQLAELYLAGHLGEIDYESAEKVYLHIAENGDTETMISLRELYVRGELGNKDPQLGLDWIAKAIKLLTVNAKRNDIDAAVTLAELYMYKDYGVQDYYKAVECLIFAACHGHAQALQDFMKLYLKNKFRWTQETKDKIFPYQLLKLIEKQAMDKNSISAFKTLAKLYDEDFFPKSAVDTFNPWSLRLETIPKKDGQLSSQLPSSNENDASSKSHKKTPEMMFALGEQFRDGKEGKPKDICRAAFWFRKASNKDHVQADLALGQLFYSGALGDQVRPVAVRFFRYAAKEGNLEATQTLVQIYREGKLAVSDQTKLEKWQHRESLLLKPR